MARSASKILMTSDMDPVTAARLSNEAIVTDAIDKAIGTIRAAAKTAKTAMDKAEAAALAATGTREKIMRDLAKLANDGGWTDAMVDAGLDAAFEKHYADYKNENGKFPSVGTVAVIRSELKRATNPKIRAQLPAILAPWVDAFDADETAIADAKKNGTAAPETPVKDRFHSRHQMVTQAMTLAIGKAADKNGKNGTPSYVPADTDAVHSWVRAHPRGTGKGAKTSTATATATANADGTPLTPRQIATGEIEEIVARVRELSAKYKLADCFNGVLAALAKCTGDKLVPNVSGVPTPVAGAPTAPPVAAEPVAGASDMVDEAMADPVVAIASNDMLEQFKQFQAFQAMMAKNAAK